jgi:transcription antitermination factor NusA-like protein
VYASPAGMMQQQPPVSSHTPHPPSSNSSSQHQQQSSSSTASASAGDQQQQKMMIQQGPEAETVYLYIPNVAVGAIIGTKGSFIKNIIKLSGASVKITPLSTEESKNAVERQVVIIGTPESQWKAQYYIYEKIRQERFATDDNVKLRAEIQVPSAIVGRIIGKSGKNVRELQRTTGATIKLPEDLTNSNGQAQSSDEAAANADETIEKKAEQEQPESPAAETTTLATTTEPVESSTNEATEAATTTTANSTESPSTTPAPTCSSTTTPVTPGFVIVRIFGTFNASQCAQRRIQALVSHSLRPNSAAIVDYRSNVMIGQPQPYMNHYSYVPQHHNPYHNSHYNNRDDSSQQPRTNGAFNKRNKHHTNTNGGVASSEKSKSVNNSASVSSNNSNQDNTNTTETASSQQ